MFENYIYMNTVKTIEINKKEVKNMITPNETILNSIQEGVMVIDRNLNVLNANSYILDSLGLEKQDIIGRPCYSVTQCDMQEGEEGGCPLFEALKTGKPSTKRCKRPDKNGDEFHVAVTVYPLLEENGTDRFLHIERDVTEQVMTEKEVKKYIDTLKKR